MPDVNQQRLLPERPCRSGLSFEFASIFSTEPKQLPPDAPKVLFIAPRSGLVYDLALMGVIARRLIMENRQPYFVLCDNLPMCSQRDNKTGFARDNCDSCMRRNVDFLSFNGFSYTSIWDYLEADDVIEAHQIADTVTIENLPKLKYHGLDIGYLQDMAAARYFFRDKLEHTEHACQVARQFVYSAVLLTKSFERIIDCLKPELILACDGKTSWTALALGIARLKGIRAVSYEDFSPGGCGCGWSWGFSNEDAMLDFSLRRAWEKWKNIQLTDQENEILNVRLKTRRRGGYYAENSKEDLASIEEELGLKLKPPIITLYSNVSWDFAVLHKHPVFSSMFEWVCETIRFFAGKPYTLLVRVHPGEKDLCSFASSQRVVEEVGHAFRKLPDNVKLIPAESRISTYKLIDISEASLVYTSTVGLESVIAGKPAVVCSLPRYGQRGFTVDMKSKEEYFSYLEDLKKIPPVSREQVELARRYYYILAFRVSIPLGFYGVRSPWHVSHYCLADSDEILPGCHPYLDFVVDRIVDGGDFTIPRRLNYYENIMMDIPINDSLPIVQETKDLLQKEADYQQILVKNPDNKTVWHEMQLLEAKFYPMVHADVGEIKSFLTQAQSAVKCGRIDLAVEQFEHILEKDPNHADALEGLARILLRYKQPDNAGILLQRVLRTDPTKNSSWQWLINVYKNKKNIGAAVQITEEWLSRQPNHIPALLQAAALVLEYGNMSNLRQILEKICYLGGHPAAGRLLASLGLPIPQRQSEKIPSQICAEQTGLEYEPVLQPATKAKSPAPRLSVILTTYNRQRLLTKVLSGFANQAAPKEDFEVIVVDDGSEPPVKEIVEKFYDRINITYLHQENSGLAAARNNGMRAANGDIVLLCDDDDVPDPELIAEHLRSHQEHPDEQIAVLGYRYWHPDLEITPVMHHIIHVGGEYFGYDRMSDGEIYDHWKFWGGVTSVKTTLLEGMKGPFDSRLGFGYEDTELSCRLASKGLRVLYNSKAKSFVLVPVDFEGFCKRRYMQGRALYRMACIHPEVIIPRYKLQDAANLYHSRYAPFLEEWADKVVKFEPLLNNQTRLKDFEHNRYLKSLYTVYRECFKGYWLKGYVEEMETVKSGRVSLSEPVNTKGGSHFAKDWKMVSAGVAGNNVESGYDQLNAPRVAEPLRITFISSHTPGFDRGSSNLRIYHILKIVEGSGARIDYLYFCRTEDDERYKKAFGDSVNFVYMPRKINCFTDYLYFDRSRKIDYVWITNLWGVAYGKFAVKLSEWIKANKSGTKIIIDTMDFHYKKFMRKFNVSRDNQDLLKAKEFLEVEKKLYPLADEVLTVTEVEKRDIFENIGSDCNVSVISNIHRILPQGPDLQQRKHICFIGAFHVNHNIDAVRWFLREVFPLIIEKAPEVEFHILGSNSEKFRAEFEVNPNVKVIGYVEDAESAVANYRLFVSPMTYGAGMKGKLGTAASAGTPIVTTTIGAEGFDFVDGQNCFIADDPQEFARECLCLLSEASLWKEFSIKAKEMVAEKFGIEAVSEKIHNLLRPATTVESADKVTTCAAEVPASSDYADAVQKSRPKVSIITSCYNSEKFLPECIDSIKNQTMQDWELFLLDDASTDGTKSTIEKYSRLDERIKAYYFQDNKGPYVRRNFAIERANSDFIVIQDADDIMHPAKLETLYDEITRDKQLGIVGSSYRTFLDEFRGLEYTDSHDLPLEHNEVAAKFSIFRHGMSHGSAIIRKDLFEAIGLYDENPFAADTFWFAKAAEYAKHCPDTKFKNVPEYLTLVRIHDNSQTQLLPTLDPRNKRALYRQYCNEKLEKARQKLKELPHADIKTELKNCICSDFIEKYGHLFARCEDVPLAPDAFDGRLYRAVWSFNERNHITCIARLNSLEKVEPNLARRFKNYDLLRAMAYFAIDRKEQSLTYLNREIENHNNPAARKFISDYFEGPDFAETVRNVNSEKRLKTDVQSWCLENGKFYNLCIIDLENKRDTRQEKRAVCRRNVPASQGEQGHSCPTSSSGQTGPLVSIIMPVYNMPDYVAEAIGSVLTQSYKNFELVVADDGSTDNTKDIILGFKDERVKYFYKENGGPYSARNLGMKNAGGDFIVPLDADDMITPDYIARHLQEFERCPDADLIYCDDCLIEEDCKPIRVIERPEYTDRKLLIRDLFRCGFPIVPFRTCIRKSVFDRIGLFDDGFRNAMDYDMIRRFVKHGLKAHHLKAPLYLRRMTPDSVSRKVSDEKARAHFEVLRRFTESFRYDELFPDVAWDKIAPEMRQLHAKCLAAMTYLAIGQTYVKTSSPIYARTAFGKACSELRDSLKMDPGNRRIRQLLQKCEFGRQKYDEQIQQTVR